MKSAARRELLVAVYGAETWERGDPITQDPAYQHPQPGGQTLRRPTRASLPRLLKIPVQQERLSALAPDLDAKRAELARTIDLASSGNVADALALVRTGMGLELMDRINTVLRAFIDDEDAQSSYETARCSSIGNRSL